MDAVKALSSRSAANTVCFNGPHQNHLSSHSCHNALGVHQSRVAEVVKPALCENLSSCLPPTQQLPSVLSEIATPTARTHPCLGCF